MTTTAPFTELDAINSMLAAIGEASINTLSGSTTMDVILAQNILNEELRKFQLKGWSFNTDYEFPFPPNEDGEIVVGSTVIRFDLPRGSKYDVVQRGQRLYDRKTRSYTFTETVKANIVQYLDFNDMPEAARMYVMVKSALKFQSKAQGSDTQYAFDKEDLDEAWTTFLQSETETGDYNIFNNNAAQDILNRSINGGGYWYY
jgi:hypothetical protein